MEERVVGTLFAFSRESGFTDDIKEAVWHKVRASDLNCLRLSLGMSLPGPQVIARVMRLQLQRVHARLFASFLAPVGSFEFRSDSLLYSFANIFSEFYRYPPASKQSKSPQRTCCGFRKHARSVANNAIGHSSSTHGGRGNAPGEPAETPVTKCCVMFSIPILPRVKIEPKAEDRNDRKTVPAITEVKADGGLQVFTDARASPTGFPFKTIAQQKACALRGHGSAMPLRFMKAKSGLNGRLCLLVHEHALDFRLLNHAKRVHPTLLGRSPVGWWCAALRMVAWSLQPCQNCTTV
eukprot:3612013-Pyramimonas_sp.AAC.1